MYKVTSLPTGFSSPRCYGGDSGSSSQILTIKEHKPKHIYTHPFSSGQG